MAQYSPGSSAYSYPYLTISAPLAPPPQVFSNATPNPTIFGTCDGINVTFVIGVALSRMQIWRNGVLQTNGTDVVNGPNALRFLAGSVPQAGDLLTILGYVQV